MRARVVVLGVLVGLGAAAAAHPPHGAQSSLTPQSLSAAAVRVAAPFGTITSTFRTVAHNRAVGGVKDSYHLFGRAIDIVRRPGVSHTEIAAALKAAGLHLIESLDEGNHSHFAFGAAPRGVVHAAMASSAPRHTALLAADQHGTLRLDIRPSLEMARPKVQLTAGGRKLAPARPSIQSAAGF